MSALTESDFSEFPRRVITDSGGGGGGGGFSRWIVTDPRSTLMKKTVITVLPVMTV